MKKKIISIILALTMVLGMVPFAGIPAFAEDANPTTPTVTINEVKSVEPWDSTKGEITVDYSIAGIDATTKYTVVFEITANGETKSVKNEAATLTEGKQAVKTIETTALFGEETVDSNAKVKVSLTKWKPTKGQLWEGGPIWAESNVGATNPEDPGYYFYWGSPEGYTYSKKDYVKSVSTGKEIQISRKSKEISPYQGMTIDQVKSAGLVGEDGNLLAKYDAANAYLGSSWRMPTKDEMVKLIAQSSITKETNGYTVTGKGDYAENSILIPLSGEIKPTRDLTFENNALFWSSTPNTNKAYFIWRNKSTSYSAGKNAIPVRAVRDATEADVGTQVDIATAEATFAVGPSHKHTLNIVEAKEASCTEDGISTTYYVCEGEGSCGKYFSDENGENEISAETAQGYTIGKTGHSFIGNYINYEGNKWAKKCSRCDTYDTEHALTGVAVPTAKTGLVYNGETQTGVEAGTGYSIESNTGKDAGTYTATAKIADGYIWADGTLTDKPIEWEIAKATVAVPTITGNKDNMFLYTGKEIKALESNDYYTVENGNKTATGKYTATVTLKDTKNYEWAENFDGEIEWYIVNAEYYLTTAPTTTEDGAYNQRAYYMDGDTKVTVEANLLGEDQSIDFAGWYLRSMIQYKMDGDNYDIRFISMLNGECFADDKLADYESAGFIISIGDETFDPLTTTIGYTSFLADGKEISITDYSDNPNGTDFFFLMNTTFATADIDVNTEIKVTPFVKLIDGETTLEGNTASFTLSQLIKK